MDHFHYANGVLHAEDVPVPALAEHFGTPFYCYSTATLLRHYAVFCDALAPLQPMVCFAAKANSSLAVLRTLARAGAGADVVSGGEIAFALAAGIPPERIVFSGVGKTREEMAYALAEGIFQFNAESAAELTMLEEAAKTAGKTAQAALRVNPDVTPDTHAKISTGQKESKFGIPCEEAARLYRAYKNNPHVRLQGVSVHIGSQLTSLAPFEEAFRAVRAFVEMLRGEGLSLETIDLGGGLGVPYAEHTPPEPAAYAARALAVFEGFPGRFIFEPGRLLAGNAGILVARVTCIKETETKRFAILDAGMNDLLRPALYDAHHTILPVQEAAEGTARMAYDVVGPVCESSDVFGENRLLPALQAGDLVVFRTAGAYGASMSSTYNLRPLVPEVLVHGTHHALTRPRLTVEELLEREMVPEWLR